MYRSHRVLPALLACMALAAAATTVPKGVLKGTGHTVGFGELQNEEWRGEVINLGWAPRAFLLKGFLKDEECDFLIKKAEHHMSKSSVVDSHTGKSVPSKVRTSTGYFFKKGDNDVVSRIEKRVAQATMIPVSHQEGLQILHYEHGQKYEPHNDYFHDEIHKNDPAKGGQRVVTVLMYLTTPEEGGETVFPAGTNKATGPEWSDCAKAGMAVKAFKGDAVLFYSLKPDGSNDPSSLHGSCPTTKGHKWSATKWIHVLPIGGKPPFKQPEPGECGDTHEQCKEWAFFGECTKNPSFMDNGCPAACGKCSPPAGGDTRDQEQQAADS